jgi:CDP-diacylglycerol--glycerol-3-phosphate 3-phosphatidyltransferase
MTNAGIDPAIDVVASVVLASALTLVLGAHVISSLAAGRVLTAARVDREADLPFVGKAPMHAVYRALVPLGRGLVRLGVSANAVSLAAVVIACVASVAFALGHFGVAAAIASIASLADGLDGLVARLSGSKSRLGQILDTTIDRYVDAMFLGGIAIFVRESVPLLAITLAALLGAFMVSYASAVERELGVEREVGRPGPMRRSHRLAYLIVASACAPLAWRALEDVRAGLFLVFVAVGAIAIVGNVSAVHRLLEAARVATAREIAPASGPDLEPERSEAMSAGR